MLKPIIDGKKILEKNHNMNILILISIFWILAAICNAVMDVLAFKFKTSIFSKLNESWWNPSKSWRNKYKDKNPKRGPAFFGSTTFLSFLTDAWHFFQFLTYSFIALGFTVLIGAYFDVSYLWMFVVFLGFKFVWGAIFELFFSKIFRS